MKKAGLKRKPVCNRLISEIEPTINLENFYGGFYTESDMSGDIHTFTKQLAEICLKNNVTINYNSNITNIKNIPKMK